MIEYTFKKVTTARALAGRQPTVCAHSTRSALSRTAYSEAHGVLPLTVSALYSASHASICMSGVRTHAVQIDFQKKTVTHWTTVRPQTFFSPCLRWRILTVAVLCTIALPGYLRCTFLLIK
jgi:hypothetical protein